MDRGRQRRWQSRFSGASVIATTSTICNYFRAIAVSAYDGTQASRPPTVFSAASHR